MSGLIVAGGTDVKSPCFHNPRQARQDYHIGTRPGRAQPNYGFRIVLDLAMKTAAEKN